MKSILILAAFLMSGNLMSGNLMSGNLMAGTIDRKAVVSRHNIKTADMTQILALGNGEFCFGIDGTGLQTFGGNIMSNWAWHSFPLPDGATMADVPETGTIETGRLAGEMKQASAKKEVSDWMFRNPHKFNMGRFRFTDRNGKALEASQISNSARTLDLWKGIQTAEFTVDGKVVKVTTLVHPVLDLVTTRIESELLGTGDLSVTLDFPYPVNAVGNKLQDRWYGQWDRYDRHLTTVSRLDRHADFIRKLDETIYHVKWQWSDPKADFAGEGATHTYRLSASPGSKVIEFECAFSLENIRDLPGFESTVRVCEEMWEKHWLSGGAIDLSESSDPRWKELERRIVLSQYLMRTQSAGSWPPAEVSLMGVDFWSSQFHMEMIWWHLAHYGLWNRWELAEEALGCYETYLPMARKLASQFGYKGAKWGKQVGPEGRTAPWNHSFLLHWQQPHPIFFAELDYRLHPTSRTIEKWETIVSETAVYMADFPVLKSDGKYHLTPVCTANENDVGDNPAFENAYWRWALAKAQDWRERAGLPREKKWDQVLNNLAPLPQANGVYLFCDGWLDSYTRLNMGHPDPLGPVAFLPFVEGVDRETARRTVEKIDKEWQWDKMWGWDYPWSAMAAARVGRPDLAIELLLKDTKQNDYTMNGINEGWYFPGNGGLLYAVAMMAAGWDGAPDKQAPGFPGNGQWVVRWEGLKPAL
jgi:hypothetical protein